MFLPQYDSVSSKPTQNNRQNFIYMYLNPLMKKLYPSDLKTQFVPRSKHSLHRL
jgi:hypothetical protein